MMEVTDADRTLAADLGLILVREPETDADRQLGTDPRATRTPETWTVKAARDKRVVGRLYFTPADCLYASKFTAGISGIEETVADALRWIAPLVRHARTGQYDGIETVVPRFKTAYERPRALTECGAKATAADYNCYAAKSAVFNGEAGEMCPACKKKLEDKGIVDKSSLPEHASSSTQRQRGFIRRLLDEAARCGRPYLIDARGIDQMSSRSASATIDALKSLKARNWKGDL
ncbi:MAG TPA: hypothetical protein VLE97_09550 [Gaiellaceae bacterium]|nr:hypothetical protein [Gaiellaceae bacterium]